jgi:hypothetical protein
VATGFEAALVVTGVAATALTVAASAVARVAVTGLATVSLMTLSAGCAPVIGEQQRPYSAQ